MKISGLHIMIMFKTIQRKTLHPIALLCLLLFSKTGERQFAVATNAAIATRRPDASRTSTSDSTDDFQYGAKSNLSSEHSSNLSQVRTNRMFYGLLDPIDCIMSELVPMQESDEEAAPKLYDTIIVGGGGVGLPLARTLADAGKEVLVIERGTRRKDHPDTLDIHGAGMAINNEEISQLIVTNDGIRSLIASVVSGGSAINMGVVVQETQEYWNYLETFPGVSFDAAKLKEASDWTIPLLTHPMPETLPYGRQWRLSLEKVFGKNAGYHYQLQNGTSWSGASAFDPNQNWFRSASDVTLGTPRVDVPKTLQFILGHTVHKIEFKFNKKTQKHRATCVLFAKTTLADKAPMVGRRSTFRPGMKNAQKFSALIPKGTKYTACVKPGGEIISSAGAILTPLLMYRSGVGPSNLVRNVGVPLVKRFDEIGQNLRDRVFIPVGLFFKKGYSGREFPPRICQSLAYKIEGPRCQNYRMGKRTLLCSGTNAGEISGGRIGEGALYASRYVIPLQHRSEPIVDRIFNLVKDCASERITSIQLGRKALCHLVKPLRDCFRRVATNYYFTSEPKSVAQINIASNGDFTLTGNYLTHPQDLEDAKRGIANIIRIVNSGLYKGVFESPSSDSCPLNILNKFIDLIDSPYMSSQNVTRTSNQNKKNAKKWIYEQLNLYNEQIKQSKPSNSSDDTHSSMDSTNSSLVQDLSIFGASSSKQKQRQRYATYPPTLPEPTDAEGLKKYARSWMTSIWHWVGSASMGVVVDNHFKVKGFENLRIIDASVLPQVTRMDPIFTLTAMGRYAGLVINSERTTPSSRFHQK